MAFLAAAPIAVAIALVMQPGDLQTLLIVLVVFVLMMPWLVATARDRGDRSRLVPLHARRMTADHDRSRPTPGTGEWLVLASLFSFLAVGFGAVAVFGGDAILVLLAGIWLCFALMCWLRVLRR